MRKVEEIRADIDRCDEKLLSAFVERTRLVREIAWLKAKAGQPTIDVDRERAILERSQLFGPHAQTLMNQVLALCRLEMYDELESKESTNDRTT
jgi:chorismate mutase